MMAYPYDDTRTMLALQIDHSRVAGYFAAHWGNKNFDRPQPYSSVSWPPASMTSAGGSGRCARPLSTIKVTRWTITTGA